VASTAIADASAGRSATATAAAGCRVDCLVTDFLVVGLVAGAFAAVFFAAGAVRADLLVTFAEAVEVFEAVLLTTAFLRVMTFDEVARAGLAAGLVGGLVRRVPVVPVLLDREAAAGRLAVPAVALPVPATRARVVVLGLPVARVLLVDEQSAIALLVLLALAASVPPGWLWPARKPLPCGDAPPSSRLP